MKAARSAGSEAGQAGRRPKWYLLYYLLAALDVVTVLASVTLTQAMMQIHVDSVATSQRWAKHARPIRYSIRDIRTS